MVDDHVDRPGVEVRQRMELTGTNRSTGLIANRRPVTRSGKDRRGPSPARGGRLPGRGGGAKTPMPVGRVPSIDGLVAIAGDPAPDPIPNSAVKAPSADGTALQGAGE